METQIIEKSKNCNSITIARELKVDIGTVEECLINYYYKDNYILTKQQLLFAAKDIYDYGVIGTSHKYNISDITLRKYLNDCRLFFPKKTEFNNNINDELGSKLIRDYENGISLDGLERLYFINRKAISKYLKEKNVCTDKITFDDLKFDIIDTEEKAYWLGFFYADGAVGSSNNHFELSLKLLDVIHLYKLKKFMNSKRNVACQFSGIQRCRMHLISKHFKTRLCELGCIPNKSLILKFPDENLVPKNLIKHFIRGYFDGDGCISYSFLNKEKDIISPRLSLLGTENFLNGCMEYLPKVNMSKANKDGSEECKEIKWNKTDSITILNYLYEDANIYLDRKYNRYLYFKNNNFAVFRSDFKNNDQAISVKAKQFIKDIYNIDIDILHVDTEITAESNDSVVS